jgi:hypothetical protein
MEGKKMEEMLKRLDALIMKLNERNLRHSAVEVLKIKNRLKKEKQLSIMDRNTLNNFEHAAVV